VTSGGHLSNRVAEQIGGYIACRTTAELSLSVTKCPLGKTGAWVSPGYSRLALTDAQQHYDIIGDRPSEAACSSSFGAGDTSVNKLSRASSAGLKALHQELTASTPDNSGTSPGSSKATRAGRIRAPARGTAAQVTARGVPVAVLSEGLASVPPDRGK
jgi:hypothetical protein